MIFLQQNINNKYQKSIKLTKEKKLFILRVVMKFKISRREDIRALINQARISPLTTEYNYH